MDKGESWSKQGVFGCERASIHWPTPPKSSLFVSCHGSFLDNIEHLLQPHLKVKWKIYILLAPSPIDWGTWLLFAAVLVQWRRSWCSGRLLRWQHQQSELPSPSPGPPGLRVRTNARCLHPAPPGDCQRGTSSEHCRSLPPQVCKVYTHTQIHSF